MTALPRILHPEVVNERISRLRVVNTVLQDFWGMNQGGPNERTSPGRAGSYDVFDDTREVATATLPGGHATTVARQKIGNVAYNIPRSAEKMPLLMEQINQLRAIGGPTDVVDSLGEKYIFDQERVFKQRFTNLREFQVSAMMRGSYTYTQTGDEFIHGYSGGAITVDYQIPSGNKNQLDMTGSGNIIGTTWDNPAAPIVRDLFAIGSAFNQNVGRGLTDIWCTSVVWGFVITNTEVQDLAGSVNDPVQSFSHDPEKEDFTAVLRGAPWVTWHIMDNGLNLNGTFNKLIDDASAVFTTRPDPTVAAFYQCPEPVVDPVSNQMRNAVGETFYHKIIDDPVSYEMHGRFNGLPVLFIPSAIANGTVDF